MKCITAIAIFFVCSFAFAQAPQGYYTSAEGLTGYALKSELSTIITQGHEAQGYSALWDAYYTSDRDVYYENDQTLLDIYSENPSSGDPYNFNLGDDQCGNYSGEGSCYNREHLMPQSWFNENSPMKSDIHHVYPTDGYVNGIRGHLPFGEVGTADFTSDNGSKRGNNSFPDGYTGTVFEPIDEFKGDIARVYFYMATRYEDQIAGWENVNDGSQNTLDGSSDHVFEDWMLEMLLEWHNEDPVSPKETDRNNAAYNFQGNRNPFIDHPEYVNSIWENDTDPTALTPPQNLNASNISTSGLLLSWEASSDNSGVSFYEIEQDGTVIGSTETTGFSVTDLEPNTTYSFQVFALDNSQNRSEGSNSLSATTATEGGEDNIVQENFNDCSTISFVAVSELSDQNWECQDFGGVNDTGVFSMNGYSDGSQVPSVDWLITESSIDFSNYSDETLSFETFAEYGDTELQLLYSEDYDGNGTPSDYNWTPVPNVSIPLASGDGEDNYSFNNIAIDNLTGEVYFGFKYDNSNGENATRWKVDDFMITAQESLSIANPSGNSLTIYPNPAQSYFKVEGTLNSNEPLQFTVYNLAGKRLKKGIVQGQSVSVEGLSTGMYLVKITSAENTHILQLIVK